MPKRKTSTTEDDDFSAIEEASAASSQEESGSEVASKTSKKQKLQKQKKDSPPANKKVKEEGGDPSLKVEPSESEPISGEVHVLTTAEGDKYIDLGKKKRAVVRSFKGVPLLDIREFYGADGQEKPGKKGIALTLDQWQLLKEGTNAIDKLLAGQKKK